MEIQRDHGEEQEDYDTTPCTLLVPEDLCLLLEGRLKELGISSFSIYFREILWELKARVLDDSFPVCGGIKIRYQERGGALRKVSFRSSLSDWGVLSGLSAGTGLSRCYIFVLLLMIDLGLIEIAPTKSQSAKAQYYLLNITTTRSINIPRTKTTKKIKFIYRTDRWNPY